MRWLVEVTAVEKTDLQQRFVVEAESWQRALQGARAQRGEDGPMSGFAIELLDEGYRAADPVGRVKFVVKRAADDLPLTAPVAPVGPSKDAKSVSRSPASIRPSAIQASASVAPMKSASTPVTTTTTASSSPPPGKAPRPMTNGPSSKKGLVSAIDLSKTAETPAAPVAVGTATPGLPAVKVLTSREQDPTESSPLTYREYAFAVSPGTSEDTGVAVLRAQLELVDAHLSQAKLGKLVNLAVFDADFTGKPPAPPLATLTWKDWKGEPVIGYPRRGGAQKQPKPPGSASNAPSSIPRPLSSPPPAQGSAPPGSIGAAASVRIPLQPPANLLSPADSPPQATANVPPAPFGGFPPAAPVSASPLSPIEAPSTAVLSAPAAGSIPPPPVAAPRAAVPGGAAGAQAVMPVGVHQPSFPPPAPASAPPPATSQMSPPAGTQPSSPPPPGGSVPPAAVMGAVAAVATFTPSGPATVPPPTFNAAIGHAPGSDGGLVRTPSGRFVRGRTVGDELISALFESMHDLHFLRDALDGGQFCLALATEVLPARAAIIHFFDIEKREWVVACTRGKDAGRLLTMRTPDSDELLRDAARKRRAVVLRDASNANAARYQSLGGSRSLIIAPIMQAGRALGALEIINPLDGMPFNEDEAHAMTYIAEQYAEYLGSRGIVLDRDRIQSAALPR